MKDAVATFLHDHERLDFLIDQYFSACETGCCEPVERWRDFSAGLRRHATREAAIFGAYARAVRPPAGVLEEIDRQHAEIFSRLTALDGLSDEAARLERSRALLERLLAHERAEEAILLPWLRDSVAEPQHVALVSLMERVVERV